MDLIRIQKHLLGIEELDSPFKHIAADANNSQSISAVDLLELRKLILRITSTLPNNTSWRFVPRSYEFPDSTDPWPFAEQSDLTELDFIGIKVGDVNGTVSEPSRDPYGVFDLHFPDGTIESNSTTRIPVLAGSNVELQGLQLTLESINGRITNLEDGLLDVSDGMFAIHKHAVAVAWHTVSPVQVVDGDTLFYIQFYPDVRTSIHDAISTSSRLISAEAYALTDHEDRKLGIQSEFVPGKLTDGLEIFPNPAVNEINVRLKPGFGDVRYIRIYDVNGTLLVHTNKSRRANGAFSVHFASDMPRGLYIIGVETTTGQILHRKVIVGS